MTGATLFVAVALVAPAAGTRWLTRPCQRAVARPNASSLPVADVALELGEGARLAGWSVEAATPGAPRAAVLVLHGRGSSRQAMVARGRFLREQGCAALLLDLPGHGESGGEQVTLGAREREVATRGIDWLRARWPGAKVGAIGISMGGAALCLAAPLPLDFLVLESTYATLADAIGGRVERFYGPLAPLVQWSSTLAYEWSTGIDPATVRPVDAVATLACPLLILHGRDDPSTHYNQAEALFAAARSPKQFVPFPGASHEDLLKHSPEFWRTTVSAFLTALME